LIAEEASRLAKLLPCSVIEAVAARLERFDGLNLGMVRDQIAQAVPSPHHRAFVVAFLDRWRSEAADLRNCDRAIGLGDRWTGRPRTD